MYEQHKQPASDNKDLAYQPKEQKKYILIGGLGILLFIGWLFTPYASTYRQSGANLISRIAYASGLEQYSGIGDGERLIDFSLEIAGFTASRAGTLDGGEQTEKRPVVFGTGALSERENSGDTNQDNQWKLSSAAAKAIVAGDGSFKPYYKKRNVDDDQNHVVKLASEISGNDLDWILTLEAENGLWTMYRKHPNQNKDGSWDYSCGLNSYYHKDMIKRIVNKTASEKEILEYCYSVYNKRHRAFYGYKKRLQYKSRFYLVTE